MTEANILAKQLMEIIPSVMRILSAEIRASRQLPSPAQFGVMVTLAYHPCNLSSLADEQGVSLPTMSNTINTLEDRGWVSRTRSTVDRRVVNIELTESGMNHLLEIQSHAEQKILTYLISISPEESDSLAAGLTIMGDMFKVTDGLANKANCDD
jgi:DNA-binding MarR family transcriptional regulator